MLRTAEIDMADSVKPSDIDVFLSDAAWAISSTYQTVLKASPGSAIFGRDMLFDILFIADWKKIGEHRQLPTDRNTARANEGWIDYDYQVGQKVLDKNDGILCKAESRYLREPWLITSVQGNGYSVLLAVCSANCPAAFGHVLPICIAQNILVNESIFFMPFILFFV
jgi:hypothetical protein